MPSIPVPADVYEQQDRNRAKVARDCGMYASEIPAFENAIVAYERLLNGQRVQGVRIIEDLGSALSETSESCNLTRRARVSVLLADGTEEVREAVVKVSGHTREPGEHLTLAALDESGVPTLKVLGGERVMLPPGTRGPRDAYIVITEYEPGVTLNTLHPEQTTPAEVVQDVIDRVRRLAPLRAADRRPAGEHRTFAERLELHFDETQPNLRANHVGRTEDYEYVAAVLYELGHAPHAQLIHGDPADVNFYLTDTGEILAFDPRGEIYGVPECDPGAIIAQHLGRFVEATGDRLPSVAHVETLIGAVVDDARERGELLDADTLRAVVGVTIAQWAGYGVPTPDRLNQITAGRRPDDPLVDASALATARVEATQRYALGVALTRDFGRFRGIGTVIQPSAGR